jgi:hypothetical protein
MSLPSFPLLGEKRVLRIGAAAIPHSGAGQSLGLKLLVRRLHLINRITHSVAFLERASAVPWAATAVSQFGG